MVSAPKGAVVVVAPTRLISTVRAALTQLGAAYQRNTEVRRAIRPLTSIIGRAREALPPRGVVVVVGQDEEADSAIALGADEVVVEPVFTAALKRALDRAALRACVREDRAAEARTLEQVIAGLADSMDAPLAALALDIDALRCAGDEPTVDALEALEDCANATERVSHLVRDLHLLAPSDGDRGALEPFALPGLVDQVVRILGGALGIAHVERDDEDDLPEVLAPRRLLARTIAHVLVHAADAMSAQSADDLPAGARPAADGLRRLRISLRKDDESVVIVVDARRVHDEPPASTPLTLGAPGRLAIAREVLRSFDGELVVERARDGSVRYVLFAPRPKPGHPSLSPRSPVATKARGRRPRILLVDNDERVLRAASRAVSEHFDAVVATGGEEALSLIAEVAVDAMVVDLNLPDISGALFIDEVRRRRPDLAGRIVFVVRNRDEARLPRETPMLERPIRRESLLASITQVLDRATPPGPARSLRELN